METEFLSSYILYRETCLLKLGENLIETGNLILVLHSKTCSVKIQIL